MTLFSQEHSHTLFHPRRSLLTNSPLFDSSPSASPPSSLLQPRPKTAFDANVVLVLVVLLSALICSLCLNSIIKCALKCSNLLASSRRSATDAGVKKRALKNFPTVSYGAEVKIPVLGTECAICLADFAPGEQVKVLPECNHGFHVRCIDEWLDSHSSCPTCRHCLIGCCNNSTTAQATRQPQEEAVIIRIRN